MTDNPMERSLRAGLAQLALPLDEAQIQTLLSFGEAVLAQNQVMNLTAVTEPAAFARLHLLDSLTLLKAADLTNQSLLDVGTGAGFPGVPLKIACPSLRLTLLDSTEKKIRWLASVLPGLRMEAETLAARAETLETHYDAVTSRAVARLNLLCELCQPRVRPGGHFYALKGSGGEEEAAEAAGAIRRLGGEIEDITHITLPEGEERVIVAVRQLHPAPAGYPRPWGQMKRRPL